MRLNSPGFGTPAATWCGDFASSGWSLLAAEDMEVTGKQKVWPNNMAAVVFLHLDRSDQRFSLLDRMESHCKGIWQQKFIAMTMTPMLTQQSTWRWWISWWFWQWLFLLIKWKWSYWCWSLPIQIAFKIDQIFAEGFFHGLSCSHGLQLLVLLQPGLQILKELISIHRAA